jgi:MFS family permease
MSVYLPVAVRDLLPATNNSELGNIGAYINALFLFGWTLGGFSWGIICDRIGRKKALLFAIACYGLFTVLTGLMPHWAGVIISRFMSGFGVGGVLVISFTLLSEVWPQKTKAVFIGILSIAFPVGIFSAGLINYIVSSWRQAFWVGIVPLTIAFLGIWLIKESPHWKEYVARRKTDNTIKQTLLQGDNRKNFIRGSLIFGTMLIGLWAIFAWLPTWVQSIITASDGQKERGLSMMLLGMGGLTGGFVSGWLANAFTMRKAMITCFSVCMVMSFVLFKTNPTFSPVIYAEIAALAFFFGVSQGILSAYIPQLFPTAIRATATGFCFNLGRLLTATAVLFVGVLVNALGGYGNAIFIFSLVFVVGWLVMILVKDKK